MNKDNLKGDMTHVKSNISLSSRVLILLLIAASLIFCSMKNYLLFHAAIEMFCIIMAFSLFVITINAHKGAENRSFTFLGMAYGFGAVFTVLHVITYGGISILTEGNYNVSVQFRIISAYFESISLFIFSIFLVKGKSKEKIIYVYGMASVLLIMSVLSYKIFPVCFIEGVGQTPFKIASEFIIITLFALSLYRIIKNRHKLKYKIFTLMVRSTAAIMISEIFFTIYSSPASVLNGAGHFFKLLSYYFVYRLVVEMGLNSPYALLKKVNAELKKALSDQQQAEEELGIQRAYFQQLFESCPEGIVILDSSDKIVKVNKGFENIFQYESHEIVGEYLNKIIVPDTMYDEATSYTYSVLEGEIVQQETVRLRKDGSSVNVYILGYPVVMENSLVGVFGIYRDITEQKKAEEKIRYLSFHDKLTGLYNRAFFEEELKRLDTERQLPISLIMGDMNNLKLANDAFSHNEGDRLLINIANILRQCCREEDIIARWGGDEFVLLLPKTGEEDASRVCERIMKACLECTDGCIKPSIALGVATKKNSEQNIEKILGDAERMMYKNKIIDHSRNYRISIAPLGISRPDVINDTTSNIQ